MRKYYHTIFLLFIANWCLGQATSSRLDIKSPNVSNLGTFGEIPVSLFTGTPNISVPLFEISGNTLNLPLTINYHPGNVKPNQRSGWTGLGWSIPSGVIYREVRGQIDEMDNSYTSNTGYYFRRNLQGNDWHRFGEAPNLSGVDLALFHRQMGFYTDMEADIYHFNVMGISGSFFLDHNGSWQVQSDQYITVELDREQPLIEPLMKYSFNDNSTVSRQFNKFILKDGYGNIYTFGGVEATEYTSSINAGKTNINGSIIDASGFSLQASAWYISKIEAVNNAEIMDFKYERGPFLSSLYKYAYYNQTFKTSNCQNYGYGSWLSGGALLSPVYTKEIRYKDQKIVFSMSKSNELNYEMKDYADLEFGSNESHLMNLEEFLARSIQYVPYYSRETNSRYYDRLVWMKLDSITLYNAAKKLGDVSFVYNNDSNQRLFLQKVIRNDAEKKPIFEYSFNYNEPGGLPKYLSSLTDHWGVNNGSLLPGTISGSGLYNLRQPNTSFIQKGLLKEIKYPTGGRSSFEFQLGDFSKIVDSKDRKKTLTESGNGGIRISRIVTYDERDSVTSKKEYQYKKNAINNGNISSGVLNNKPLYYIGTTSGIDMSGGSFTFSSIKSSSFEDLNDQAGVSIGYTEVLETSYGGNEKNYSTEIFTNHDNGYTDDNAVYYYKADLLSNKPVNSRAFERGRSLRKILYNGAKDKIKVTQNVWESKLNELESSRSLLFNFMDVSVECNVGYYYPSSISYLNYYHSVNLKSTTDSLFTSTGNTSTLTEYKFNSPYKQLVEKKVHTSKESTLETRYSYSGSFGSQYGKSYSVYDKMISRNMVSYPIEEVISKDNRVIEAKVTEYRDFMGKFKPYSDSNLEAVSPSQLYSSPLPLEYINGELEKDANMRVQNRTIAYDQFGNPTVTTNRSNSLLTYQWGYGGQYPVVKIKNASDDIVLREYSITTESKSLTSYNTDNVVFETDAPGTISLSMVSEPDYTAAYYSYGLSGPYGRVGSGSLVYYRLVSAPSSAWQDILRQNFPSQVSFGNQHMGRYSLGLGVSRRDGIGSTSFVYSYPKLQMTDKKIGDKEFFYEGFEENAIGTVSNSFAVGNKCFFGDYKVPFKKTNSRKYLIDYKYISNNKRYSIQKPFVDNMVLSEGEYIDEVRVYPMDAEMTSCTYEPLVGMTSMTDSKGVTEFYEYDNLQRLKRVLDDDGNVLKVFEYNYKKN